MEANVKTAESQINSETNNNVSYMKNKMNFSGQNGEEVVAQTADANDNAETKSASTNDFNKDSMKVETLDNNMPCCPKNKTTVIAMINGEECEITLARTMYSMDMLKKSQEKFLEEVDKSKLLDEIFHFSTTEIFYNAGIKLYNLEGVEIPEGTENVLVPVETSGTYWRFTFDDVLKHVQVHTFESVEEFAQVTGTTDLFSRSRNTVEKLGIAALATGDETYNAVYELAHKTGMPGSSAMAYLGVQLKNTTTMAMTMGTKKELPVATRTLEEALELHKQVCLTFTPAEGKKRYTIRAINSVMHANDYSLNTIMQALKALPSDEVQRARLMDCGSKETCIANVLLNFIIKMQPKEAA